MAASNPKRRGSDDDLSLEGLIDEHSPRRIFRTGGSSAEPDQGPEGGSGTAQSEKAPETGNPD